VANRLTVRETIDRDLGEELPGDGVVKVAETSLLEADLRDYVLTGQLAADYEKVFSRIVESAAPAAPPTAKVGIWVSGFFGSGKSHFAKLAGHVLADTPAGASSARAVFRTHLQEGRPADDRVDSLLQQASNYRLRVHLVPFDISTLHTEGADVGVTFLRAFYQSLGLSSVMPFAEMEMELQEAGKWEEFLPAYRERSGADWAEDREMFAGLSTFAELLAVYLPQRHSSAAAAENALNFAQTELESLTIDGAVRRMLRWADRTSNGVKDPLRIIFVADEVGAWSGRKLSRIEQIRALVELFASEGGSRLWLVATSQEKLSDVVQNSPDFATDQQAQELLQRLEARFAVNVHIESGEVGTVIEQRILRKRPVARPQLEDLWDSYRGQLADIGESPGIELNGNYPRMEQEAFVRDYPFLPYQLPAAAEIFGTMRSVKVSQGARSMLRVALDAVKSVADEPIGVLIGWDQVFDSANRGNEFQSEEYLGSLGVEHINRADRDLAGLVAGIIERPSRPLRVLWLIQQNNRIPRTVGNLARLLTTAADEDILELERAVEETLKQLESLSYVRREPASEEWRFLTPDEVTIEKILNRIATQDVREIDVRKARHQLVADQLKGQFSGRITVGQTQTSFEYGVYLNDVAVAHDSAPASLRLSFAGSERANGVVANYASALNEPEVHWIVDIPPSLDDRIRRRAAIERLPGDEEFQQKATQRTRIEAKALDAEAAQIDSDIGAEVLTALRSGQVYWAGRQQDLGSPAKPGSAKSTIEEAIRDRLQHVYNRFKEGDQPFNPQNTEKLLAVPPADRAALSPGLTIFDSEGHILPAHPVVDAVLAHLKSATKNSGADLAAWFRLDPRGWPVDLARYVAAALFADARLTVTDPSGKPFDNPKDPAARALFGTGPFRGARLVVEENPTTAEEIGSARKLLADMGYKTKEASELAVAEAVQALSSALRSSSSGIARATEVGLPLDSVFASIPTLIDELSSGDSRAKRIRMLLERESEAKEAHERLAQLEDFAKHHGFQQFQRTERLRVIVREAGLDADPTWGLQVTDSDEQLAALADQRRILDDWKGAYAEHRLRLLEGFKGAYVPLFEATRTAVQVARDGLTSSPEYKSLDATRSMQFLRDRLVAGRPLAEVKDMPLATDDDLLSAHEAYTINHLRTLTAALPAAVTAAREALIALLAEQQKEQEGVAKIAPWKPADAFGGRTFTDADDVTDAFDTAKAEVLELIEQGKIVKVV
jgi:hypothetical protein